ncbi:MAG: 3-deoxy-7-phosphoheptulonate synthase [Gammaproteobacteria bacterium TMED243]|nr:3-deoxy-7-phosphoheptulonate synthase [Gammaproteobacteria bacterium]RPG29773.1 MAG: 3-deoxy-7-phosphoheptulonate synthase [Gammaproteobacteria bacterium TMED243]
MQLENLNVEQQEVLITPEQLKARLPVSEDVREAVNGYRETVRNIVHRKDPRLLVVVGPCSIHDVEAAKEYAQRLKRLSDDIADQVFVVMRAYFEKPRSTVGWKGLINDPHLDDSFKVAEGLHIGRKLLLELSQMGLPLATEALDPITPQYMQDLISWSAIGARTTESQTHREMASGLSCPVGFKNGTDGSLGVAINALESVASPHRFLGISPTGQVSVIQTKGNAHGHVVLRGGSSGPNYSPEHIQACEAALEKLGLTQSIMVDCSHANSNKDHRQQRNVVNSVSQQIAAGNRSITGLMIESHLHEGNQSISNPDGLSYGVSITDACINWDETDSLLRQLAEQLASRPS